MNLHRVAFGALILFGHVAPGQLVFTGKQDPHYCDRVETIKSNLNVSDDQMVKGRITDVTGAPFRSTRVELRRLKGKKDFEVLSRVTTDRDGNFDLGLLKKGEYRLLASQDRSFKQPDDLVCSEKKGCFLAITLRVNPTDMPESTCPIR